MLVDVDEDDDDCDDDGNDMWICELSGHQLDEPMGLSGGLEQQ